MARYAPPNPATKAAIETQNGRLQRGQVVCRPFGQCKVRVQRTPPPHNCAPVQQAAAAGMNNQKGVSFRRRASCHEAQDSCQKSRPSTAAVCTCGQWRTWADVGHMAIGWADRPTLHGWADWSKPPPPTQPPTHRPARPPARPSAPHHPPWSTEHIYKHVRTCLHPCLCRSLHTHVSDHSSVPPLGL